MQIIGYVHISSMKKRKEADRINATEADFTVFYFLPILLFYSFIKLIVKIC